MNHAFDACAHDRLPARRSRRHCCRQSLDDTRRSMLRPYDQCCAHTINLLEVYYNFIRKHNEPTARQALDDLAAAGVIERRTMSKNFTRRVGQLKARGSIALPDCFALFSPRTFRAKSLSVTITNLILSFRSASSQCCSFAKSGIING